MPRIRWRDHALGWWPQGPREGMPPKTLRRAIGIDSIRTGTLRSRWGTTQLYGFSAHSLYRFADVRFQGSGTNLLRDGSVIQTGLSGDRLRFARMPPQPGGLDYLFVADGDILIKVDPSGGVSQWGIAPPAAGFFVAAGAAGVLTGRYRYAVTFKNGTTGSRSNPEPNTMVGDPFTVDLAAQKGELSSLPVSTDPQVTILEIWRTFADLTVLFKLTEIANGTTTYSDNNPDADLTSEQIQLDNTQPAATTSDCLGPYAGRMWTLDDAPGNRGRIFYSPIGRPESVQGFLEINNGDDPCLRLQDWGGAMYVWTNAHVIQVIGFDAPFTWREVFGSPGITSLTAVGDPLDARFTVVATPFGVFYHAADGIRLFDGTASRLFAWDNIAGILLGETLENIAPFEPVIAAFNGREVWFSDATFNTLAVEPILGSWRICGGPNTAFYFEEDTQRLIASEADLVVIKEPPETTTDAGAAIHFEMETKAEETDPVVLGMVQRVYLDVDTAGQPMTPVLVIDNQELFAPVFSTNGRPTQAYEYEVGVWGRLIGVRLKGDFTRQVTIYEIAADVYVPLTGEK